MNENEQYKNVCKVRFDELCKDTKLILNCLYGNGQSGLKTELAVLRTRQKILIAILIFVLIYFVVPSLKDRLWGKNDGQPVNTKQIYEYRETDRKNISGEHSTRTGEHQIAPDE